MTRRMSAFTFIAVEKDGTSREVTFYERSYAAALRNARAWAARAGVELVEDEGEGKAA